MSTQSRVRETELFLGLALCCFQLATLAAPLAAKEPPAPKPPTPTVDASVRVISDQGFRLELDLSKQVLGIYADLEFARQSFYQ